MNELYDKFESELTSSVQNYLSNSKDSNTNFSFYTYNDYPVPRVTQILDRTINKPGLLYWAASLDKRSFYTSRNSATYIGTNVHSLIEHFLKYGTDNKEKQYTQSTYSYLSNTRDKDNLSIETAYDNFKLWYNKVTNSGYKINVIATEVEVICPYYGGTIDLIAEINGAVYIIDWKTSKNISLEYYLQTCAYMYAVNNGYCPVISHIDGIGIVRLNKDKIGYEESFLTYINPEHAKYIDSYTRAFWSLLKSYYNLIYIEQFKHKESLIGIMEENSNDL